MPQREIIDLRVEQMLSEITIFEKNNFFEFQFLNLKFYLRSTSKL